MIVSFFHLFFENVAAIPTRMCAWRFPGPLFLEDEPTRQGVLKRQNKAALYAHLQSKKKKTIPPHLTEDDVKAQLASP